MDALERARGIAASWDERVRAGLPAELDIFDAHTHLGFGEKITEYDTETAYAAQGGITTILNYLLNNEAYGDVFEHPRLMLAELCALLP